MGLSTKLLLICLLLVLSGCLSQHATVPMRISDFCDSGFEVQNPDGETWRCIQYPEYIH